ncbi:hypothetical protein VQ042_05400 [Aurantimonas sp. A2-1-M11]
MSSAAPISSPIPEGARKRLQPVQRPDLPAIDGEIDRRGQQKTLPSGGAEYQGYDKEAGDLVDDDASVIAGTGRAVPQDDAHGTGAGHRRQDHGQPSAAPQQQGCEHRRRDGQPCPERIDETGAEPCRQPQ